MIRVKEQYFTHLSNTLGWKRIRLRDTIIENQQSNSEGMKQ
ncbi:hypothetical protein [Paenibacillus sp. NEAU-GSW1]|nr:hypothetical protein [Paenibacillus sp. NEAU-GSW1]